MIRAAPSSTIFNIVTWRYIYFHQLPVDKLLSVSLASSLIVSLQTNIIPLLAAVSGRNYKRRIVSVQMTS